MKQNYQVQTLSRISEIGPSEWDACAGDDPFVCHAHLLALETSKCVSPATGFEPKHLILRNMEGQLVAAAPAYVKMHSDAEIGADIGWSMAHERSCGPYYPKLQVEVPFCPFPGNRLLVRTGHTVRELREKLVHELKFIVKRLELSSLHITYAQPEEQKLSVGAGMLPGHATRFVWENRGFENLDDYLLHLKRNPRQMVRKERRRLSRTGLNWERLTGHELSSDIVDRVLAFYKSTHLRNDEKIFLNKDYFLNVAEGMPEKVFVVLGRQQGEYICGTFFFRSQKGLFAQHWGYSEYVNFAHYEATYYQSIDVALQDGLMFIDAGANGQHKVARGFLPHQVYHAHWFRDAKFSELIGEGLTKRARLLAKEREHLLLRYPYTS